MIDALAETQPQLLAVNVLHLVKAELSANQGEGQGTGSDMERGDVCVLP